MFFFDFADPFKKRGNGRKTFLPGCSGKIGIERGPFKMFALGRILQVFRRCAVRAQRPEPDLGVLGFVSGGGLKKFGNVDIPVAFGFQFKPTVAQISLCFGREGGVQIFSVSLPVIGLISRVCFSVFSIFSSFLG